MRAMARKPTPLGNLIFRHGPLRHWMEDVREQSALLEKLLAQLPPAFRPHCAGVRADGDTLVVFADSPGWATRLRYESPRILPGVGFRNLRIRVTPPATAAPQATRGTPTLPATAAALLRETAAGIADPDLADTLLRLAARHKPPPDPEGSD
jgi:hypothetical protein